MSTGQQVKRLRDEVLARKLEGIAEDCHELTTLAIADQGERRAWKAIEAALRHLVKQLRNR